MEDTKKRILSGIQPSGALTLGNYVGALRNWVNLSKTDEYECYFMLADMHTITVRQEPKDFRKNSMDLLALFIASGLVPKIVITLIFFIIVILLGQLFVSIIVNIFAGIMKLSHNLY